MSGNRWLVPYVRLFPIWKYGPRYDRLDGRYIDHGWSAEPFGQWAFKTKAEAEAKRRAVEQRYR